MTLTLFDPRSGQRITFTEPAHCPTRLRANILFMLSTVTLAYVMAPAAAQAQCNSKLNANGDWAATARFADHPGSRGFRATTPIPDVLGKFTLGAEVLSSTNWDFRLQYGAEVGDGYASDAGLGRLAYRF
jgi:hypothetical protein